MTKLEAEAEQLGPGQRWYELGLGLEAAQKVLAEEEEPGADAERALQRAIDAVVTGHVRRDLISVFIYWDPGADEERAKALEMHPHDAEVADTLAAIGEVGSQLRTVAVDAAAGWRKRAAAAWASHLSEPPLPCMPFDVSPTWAKWADSGAWKPRLAYWIARILWLGEVKATVMAERAEGALPVRHPTDLISATAIGRLYGGRLVGTDVLVTPPKGLALALPFNQDLSVSDRRGGMVGLRQVLDPVGLQVHLGTLVLYQDAGSRDEGSFEVDGPGTILDVIGATKYAQRTSGRTYSRFHSKEMRNVERLLGEVFPQIRVHRVGDLEAKGGDPLVDEITDRRSGRCRFYAHSRLIVGELRSNFTQIPRAVCKLRSEDVPVALGIAAFLRQKAFAYLKNRTPIEAEIIGWLEACGIDAKERSRKEGLAFWPRAIDLLVRVAEDGKIGKMAVAGQGRDAVLVLEPDLALRSAYLPLLESAKAHTKARREARVRSHRRRSA